MLSWIPAEGIFSYPRTAASGPTRTFQLRNAGTTPATVNLAIGGATPVGFAITAPTGGAATIAAGGNLAVSIQFTANRLPDSGATAAPAADNGGVAVSATITAAAGAGAAVLRLYGLAMTEAGAIAGGEATLGQVLATLGYAVDIGDALRSRLAAGTAAMPPAGAEVYVPRFTKASDGPVTLTPVARFSPDGPMPYGYYTAASPSCPNTTNCRMVGTMDRSSDANTSFGARMLLPPVTATANGEFDPGTAPFGIWAFTEQTSMGYGNYAYSDDGLNTPANRHRFRVWPLRDRAGAAVPNSYLLGCEEAANGDYQDYVFVISNVRAP